MPSGEVRGQFGDASLHSHIMYSPSVPLSLFYPPLPLFLCLSFSPPPCHAVIEKFTENVRFCLICNYLSKIIPALQSRCTRFRFGPLSSEQMVSRLEYVIQQEW